MADISGPSTSPLPAGPAGSPDQAAPTGGTGPAGPVPSPDDVNKFNSQTGAVPTESASIQEQIDQKMTEIRDLENKLRQVNSDIEEAKMLPAGNPIRHQILSGLNKAATDLKNQIESLGQEVVALSEQAKAEGVTTGNASNGVTDGVVPG